MTRLVRFLFAIAALASFSAAQADDLFGAANGASTAASLIAEAKSIAPGKPFTLALQLKHPSGWHSYYLNSGGIELSPAIEWQLPAGFSAGPIQWPTPSIKDGDFGKSFVYTDSPVLLVDISVPATLQAGQTVNLTAKATWQICSDSCMNETKDFSLSLPVSAAMVADPAQAEFFTQARGKLPKPNPRWSASAYPADGGFVVRLSPQGAAGGPHFAPVEFIPNERFVKSLGDGGSVARAGADWVVTLKPNKLDIFDKPIPVGKTLSGILLSGKAGTPDAAAILIPETRIGMESAGEGTAAGAIPVANGGKVVTSLDFFRFLVVLGCMLLGGLILNLMPCVFPVIGLKIMSFVNQAGHQRGKIMEHGLVFTLGVLVSFGVLSGILFSVRQAGRDINWGYQLQYPWVVLVLMLLMFILALNMFGLFEIGTSATSLGGSLQTKRGLAGSFGSGVLATVVATPCSAPFLGFAIGAAVGLPAGQFFAAFAAMGLGLSLPYLVLSAFPKLLGRLPRPGAWMESFKQAMSFLLFGATGYLLWVYVVEIDAEHMLGPVFGLVLIALAAWIYGRWFRPHRKVATRRTAVIFALVLAGGGVWLSKPPAEATQSQPDPKSAAQSLVWEPWSQAKVDELLKAGQPVYIDFTAKWCLTCQVNKLRAYTPEVVALMRKKHIVAFRADKTKPDPAIDAKMRELGRTAIPVNVLLVPGKAPIIAPEILSAAYLTELFGTEVPAAASAG